MTHLVAGKSLLVVAGLLAGVVAVAAENPRAELGATVYRQHCAHCHDNPEQSKSRSVSALKSIPSPMIAYALRDGRMQAQGEALSAQEITRSQST